MYECTMLAVSSYIGLDSLRSSCSDKSLVIFIIHRRWCSGN